MTVSINPITDKKDKLTGFSVGNHYAYVASKTTIRIEANAYMDLKLAEDFALHLLSLVETAKAQEVGQ